MSKLESFVKVAQVPTLALWAEALGLEFTFAPAALPSATLRTIEGRQTRPYDASKAHFRHAG